MNAAASPELSSAPSWKSRSVKVRLSAVVAAVSVGILLSAVPADAAGSRSIGYKSCVQGSTRSAATATGTQYHRISMNSIVRERNFASTSRPTYRDFYPGLNPVTSGYIYASGNLSSGNFVCAD